MALDDAHHAAPPGGREILAKLGQRVEPARIHRARRLQPRDGGILGQLGIAARDIHHDLHVVAHAQQVERGVQRAIVDRDATDDHVAPARGRGRGRRGALVELSPGESRGPIDIHALCTAQAGTSQKVRAFVRFLTRIMEKLALPGG